MTTITIKLEVTEHGDQDWLTVLDTIEYCLPVNQRLKVRDGLSGAIDTHRDGFHVQIEVTP